MRRAILDMTSPPNLTFVVISGGLRTNASAAEPEICRCALVNAGRSTVIASPEIPAAKIVPEPLKFGTNLSETSPRIETEPNPDSANTRVAGLGIPPRIEISPVVGGAANTNLLSALPVMSKRTWRSSGLAANASAAPDRVEINPSPV